MGIKAPTGIAAAIFGKTRRSVLTLLFGRTGQSFYLDEIVRAARCGTGAVQRELKRLASCGLIRRSTRGRHVFFEANPDCPVFAELRGLITKTTGLADVLHTSLEPLASRIRVAFVYGSLARGQVSAASDVDLLIVGSVSFDEIVRALQPAQWALGREVNPVVFPPAEFCRRMRQRDHFVTSVMKGPKLFLFGSERELAGLAEERLARGARDEPPGDRRAARRRRARPARRAGRRS
jgi:predicted nucleotidyltransferase